MASSLKLAARCLSADAGLLVLQAGCFSNSVEALKAINSTEGISQNYKFITVQSGGSRGELIAFG